MAQVDKIDSNIVGLRFAEETTIGVLPAAASQVWYELEPNTFPDFGSKTTLVPRRPINPNRQRKKGVVTDVEAMGGFNTDVTQANLQRLLQGFTFSSFRRKAEFAAVTSVSTADESYNAASGLGVFRANDLIFAAGFTDSTNNGLKLVATTSGTKITVSTNLANETPPAGHTLVCVGHQFASGDAAITVSGSTYTLTTVSKDLTQLGVKAGEWVYIGGDSASLKFATAANNGYARVRSVSTNAMVFDKTYNTMVSDAGTSKTIQIFLGRVLQNENYSSIVRRTYALERTLGSANNSDTTKEQAEYLNGSVPNELTINAKQGDKLTADLSFVALNQTTMDENVTGANTLLSKAAGATRVAVTEADAFNSTSDVVQMRLAVVSSSPNPTPLYTYCEDLSLKINNGAKLNKAISVLGGFDVSVSDFAVSGSIQAYFGNVAAIEAVKAGSDVTLDVHLARSNAGISIDLPLITLGNGVANVQMDEPIKIPLDNEAASGKKVHTSLDHTLLMVFFDYLPTAAM
jgi:hypothetical protein